MPQGRYSPGTVIQTLSLELLGMFQAVRSVLGPPCCRFHPSCSDYAREAIEKFGVFNAAPRILSRLARCHPLHPGGFDPVEPSIGFESTHG